MKLFGREYEMVGSEGKDICLITKGKVKVKWGKKFIDLIKDGKLNVDGLDINRVKDKDSIGNVNGIYVTDDGAVYLRVGDMLIPLYGDGENSMFVAYVKQEGKTGEEMSTAQANIGISFASRDVFLESGIKDGITYIIDERTLYKVIDGNLYPLDANVGAGGDVTDNEEDNQENTFNAPVVINIEDGQYALLLDGYYSEDGTQLVIGDINNSIRIYAERSGKFIDVKDSLNINADGNNILYLDSEGVNITGNLSVTGEVSTDIIKSEEGTQDEGYWLGIDESGESTLFIDNIVVRNGIDTTTHINYADIEDMINADNGEGSFIAGQEYTIDDFQNEWDLVEEIFEDSISEDPDTGKLVIRYKNVLPLVVTAKSQTELLPYAHFVDHPEWTLKYDWTYNDLMCTIDGEEYTARGRITWLKDEYNNEVGYDFKHLRFLIDGKRRYTFSAQDKDGNYIDNSLTGNVRDNVIDCDSLNVERRSEPNEDNVEYIVGKEGSIISINTKETKNNRFSYITGKFVIDSEENVNDNTLNSKNLENFYIKGNFEGNYIDVEEVEKLEVNGDTMNNTVNVEKIGEMVIDGKCVGNDIRGNSITLFKVQSDFTYNHMMIDDISQPSFYGADRCLWEAGFDNCTFEQKTLVYDNFHSHFSGVSFTGERYKYLYTEKVIDMYMNDGEVRLICIPDIIFKGMIVAFDGDVGKIPAGWHICDGSNGTPDLRDRFIKGSASGTGPSDDSNSMDYPFEINSGNVPLAPHTHQSESSAEPSTGGGGGTAASSLLNNNAFKAVADRLNDDVEAESVVKSAVSRAGGSILEGTFTGTAVIPEHTHKMLQVMLRHVKRVQTSSDESPSAVQPSIVGAIYKGTESWDWKTGSGNNAQPYGYASTDNLQPVELEGDVSGTFEIDMNKILEYVSSNLDMDKILDYVKNNMDIDVDVSVGGVTGGGEGGAEDATSRVITIKEPRFYRLIFIMYIG